jgi:hypothetical protein
VFICKIPLSINVYNNAGIVERAINPSAICNSRPNLHYIQKRALRPRNSANVVNVPYSASNLSKRGVRARIFISA